MEISEFNDLFLKYYSALCCRVALIVRSDEVAEDLTQEAFVKFWEVKPVLLNREAAHAYVSKIAVNNALMYLRKKKQEEKQQNEFRFDHPQLSNETEENFSRQETESLVEKIINQLPPACRNVFVLSRYENMSYREIAQQLNISVKTVENQIGHALKVLKSTLLMVCFFFL